MNPAMAAMKISKICKENRGLCCELAQTVLQEAIEKDGAVLSKGASGDQIRQAVGIMDGPITEALQLGAAPEARETRHAPSTSAKCTRMVERAEGDRIPPTIQCL